MTNKTNKQQFIYMLGIDLEKEGCKVFHAPDFDVLIVKKAVESASLMHTVLVGDDTDLLILLCYYANQQSCDIFFRPEPKKGAKRPRVWNITSVKQQLGAEVCNNILFLHAILGCDTTSQIYMGLQKAILLRWRYTVTRIMTFTTLVMIFMFPSKQRRFGVMDAATIHQK